MSYRFFIKTIGTLFLSAFLVVTLLAAPSHAAKVTGTGTRTDETFKWDGNTIVGSGGIFSQSYFSNTFVKSGDTYTNKPSWVDSDDKPQNAAACWVTLTVVVSNNSITKISDISCYEVSSHSTTNNAEKEREKMVSTPITISGTSPEKSGATTYASTEKATAVYNAFDKKLDDIKTSYCNSIDDVSDKSAKATCLSSGFRNIVYSCWTTAQSSALTEAKHSGGGEADANGYVMSELASCLSDKTGYPESSIYPLIKNIDPNNITSAANSAQQTAQEKTNEQTCSQDGGTWDATSKTCTVPDSDETEETSSCIIDYVGWIVCPTVKFLASVADESFDFLADSFLSTPTNLVQKTIKGEDSPVYSAWKAFQNIANVLLVIGFLIIIYSQLTGVGLTNYSIKKMLPKIIIAAILINVSFYICAIAVDLSNVLGYGIKSFLAGLAGKVSTIDTGAANTWSTGDGASGFTGTALLVLAGGGGLVAGAGGVTLALVALVGVLLSAAVALITIFFILMIRQAAIVLLIVIAPVAFAMYFLPNTKAWFDKWKKTFTALLLVFPIIGIVYGASSLASTVLSGTYTSQSSNAVLGQIISAAVLILPLFIVPGLLKKSLDSVSGIGGKLSAYGSKLGGGMKGRLANSDYAKYHQGKAAKRREQIRAGAYEGRGGRFNPSNWRSTANRRIGGSSAMGAISGGYTSTLAQRGQAALARQDKEEAEASDSYVKALNLSNDELRQAALSGETTYKVKDSKGNVVTDKDGKEIVKTIKLSEDQHRAAIRSFTPIATASQAEELAEASSSMSVAARKELSTTMATSGAIQKVPHLGGKSIEDIANGTYSKSEAANNYSKNKISADSLATMDADALNTLVSDAETRQAAGDSAAMESLMKARTSLNESPELRSKIKAGSRDVIDRIPTRTTGTPPRGGTPTP